MNSTRTSGKNLQTMSQQPNPKVACEIRTLAPSSPAAGSIAFFSSSAQRQRMPRHYGPRRMRYRWVDDLKPWQVRMLHEADAAAIAIGLPLNTFITINYHGTFAGGGAMAATFKRGMKCMGQWLRDKGVKFAFVYTHENPEDEKPNTHILVHVPPKLRRAFEAKVGDWFGALDGGVRVDPRNDANRHARGQGTRLQYMTKGAPYTVCRIYGGYRAKGGQGPVTIKRAGVAQCLQAGALRHSDRSFKEAA
jgi:hypothetical protein